MTVFGWCSSTPPITHSRCKYQFIMSCGVNEGQLAVCGCTCHSERSPDLKGLDPDIIIAGPDTKRVR